MRISDVLSARETVKTPPPEAPKEKEPETGKVPTPPSPVISQPKSFFSHMNLTTRAVPAVPHARPAAAVPAPAAPPPSSAKTVRNQHRHSARVIYGDTVQRARDIIKGFSQIPVRPPDLEEICETIERLMECLDHEPSEILELVERSTPDDYMPGHLANVAVLSTAIVRQMNWPKQHQMAAGVGSILHDVGMVFHRPQYMNQPRALSEEERMFLRRLPEEGIDTLQNFLQSLSQESRAIITNIVTQFQERLAGQGYPNHLKGEQISREAQIVGLCDTYESLTHPRPYRRRKLSHYTLRYLIELSGDMFDGSLIKALWETLSLFPPGSFVKLNTAEVGKIIGLNRKLPTRPIVQVVISASGAKLDSEKIVDLSQLPGVTIQRAVDECSLPLTDTGLALELRAQKWWIK